MQLLFFIVSIILSTNAYSSPMAIGGPDDLILLPIQEYDFNDIEEKKEIIQEIVDSYRDDIIRSRGSDVELIFQAANIFQMTGGHVGDGKLEINVYAQALIKFSKLGIVSAICHELGHLLGKVPVGGTRVISADSVEGEADYFSGTCSRNYLCGEKNKSCKQAITASRSAIQSIKGTAITEVEAQDQIYPGINTSYPSPPCRLLSMILGVKGLPRPLCWYNPNYKVPQEKRIYLEENEYVRNGSSCSYLMEHKGDEIRQIARSYNNQSCHQAGQQVIYKRVEDHSNIYQASFNDLLKVKSTNSFQFGSTIPSLLNGVGNIYKMEVK